MRVHPIPEGFHTVTPTLCCDGCKDAMAIYEAGLGARQRGPVMETGGCIMHAEMVIGDSIIFMLDAMPHLGLESSSAHLHLYVPDVDAAHLRAVAAGFTEVCEVRDMFWGDRCSTVRCPYGHTWTLSSHVRDVPFADMMAASREFMREDRGTPA